MADVEMSTVPPTYEPALPADLSTLIRTLLEQTDAASAARLNGQSTTPELISSLASLAQLKALNRSTGIDARRGRQLAADAKQRMDAAQLSLQNLLYERQYLEREIRKCEEYQSEYQNVPLQEEPEFRAAQGNRTFDDGHDLTLARLQHELAERQRLEEEKKELLSRKAKLTKDNEAKKAKLDELEKQLDNILERAKTVQGQMASF